MSSYSIVVAVCLVAASVLSTAEAQCPQVGGVDFTYDRTVDRCYLPVRLSYTYTAARRYCQDLAIDNKYVQSNLVSLDTEAAQNAVKNLIAAQPTNKPIDYSWLGIQVTQGDWKWISRALRPYLEPQGCYDDITALTNVAEQSVTIAQSSDCIAHCNNNNYNYAGVYLVSTSPKQYRCRCDNIWNNNGKVVKECDRFTNRMWVYRLSDSTSLNLWHSGEPDNYQGYSRCLGLIAWEERGWDDANCGNNQRKSHICEYPFDSVKCGQEGYYFYDQTGDRTTCIKPYSNLNLNWFGARAHCSKNGGDLVVDDSAALHGFIKSTPELKAESGNNQKSMWWIGGTSSEWKWVNGAQIKSYEHWDRNKPETPAYACVRMHVLAGNGGYRWQDVSCETMNNFICETSLAPTTPAPTPDPTPAPTPDPTPAPTPDPTPAPTPAPTPDPTPAPTPDPTPAPTPAPTPDPTPAPTPDPTPAPTPDPTPAPTAPGTPAPGTTAPTRAPEEDNNTTQTIGGSAGSSGTDQDIIFTNGVIVAIVIAGVAVLVATVRLFVYCCQRRNHPRPSDYKTSENPAFTYDNMQKRSHGDKPFEDVQVANDTYASVNRGSMVAGNVDNKNTDENTFTY